MFLLKIWILWAVIQGWAFSLDPQTVDNRAYFKAESLSGPQKGYVLERKIHINCKGRTFNGVTSKMTTPEGEIVSEENEYGATVRVPSDSYLEDAFQIWCKKPKKSKN